MTVSLYTDSLRMPFAFVCAVLVSYTLFAILQQITQNDMLAVPMQQQNVVLDFVQVRHEEKYLPKPQPPKQPAPRKQPQMKPPQHNVAMPAQPFHFPSALSSMPQLPRLESGLDLAKIGMPSTLKPQFRVPPIYPLRAQTRGIEGWVEVEFSIDESGRVVAPRLVHAEPRGFFEQAALQAIRRWSYAPYIVDGKAVRRDKVRVVIDFQLQ